MKKVFITILIALTILTVQNSNKTVLANDFYSAPVTYNYDDRLEFEVQAIDFTEGVNNNEIQFRVKYTFTSHQEPLLKDVFGVSISSGTILDDYEGNDRIGHQELVYPDGSSCVGTGQFVRDVTSNSLEMITSKNHWYVPGCNQSGHAGSNGYIDFTMETDGKFNSFNVHQFMVEKN